MALSRPPFRADHVGSFLRPQELLAADTAHPASPTFAGDGIRRDGHAFLGGGTWLFSEPQVNTDTLDSTSEFRFFSALASRRSLTPVAW